MTKNTKRAGYLGGVILAVLVAAGALYLSRDTPADLTAEDPSDENGVVMDDPETPDEPDAE